MGRVPSIPKEEIERRHDALPDEVLNAFEGVDTSRNIFEIGRRHGLAIDTIGRIAEAVGYVMLGLLPAAELVTELSRIIGNQEKAEVIGNELNRVVFAPIREVLQRAYGGAWPGAPSALPTTPPAVKAPPPAVPPMPPKPKPIAEVREAPRRPEPLIIMPLPSPAQVSGGKLGGPPAAPKPITLKPLAPPPPIAPKPTVLRPAPPAAGPKPVLQGVPPKASPTIGPLGIQPPAAYGEMRAKVGEELREFQRQREPPAPTPPPPEARAGTAPRPPAAPAGPAVTRQELEAAIQTARGQTPAAEVPKAATPPAGRPTSPATAAKSPAAGPPGPPERPPGKIPKPQAPERYEVDPYREPAD